MLQLGMFPLERPADEGSETTRLILLTTNPFQVLDPLLERFDMPEHHRRAAVATQLMPNSHDRQPIIGQHLAACDLSTDSIHQDLRTTSRQTPQARSLESLEHGSQGQLIHFREVINLRRAEAVNVHLRVATANVRKQ